MGELRWPGLVSTASPFQTTSATAFWSLASRKVKSLGTTLASTRTCSVLKTALDKSRTEFVCVSRFVEYKGHRFIIDALTRLTKGGVPIELIMVGQGPLRNEIERAARKGIAKVTVLQDQSQSEIISLLRTAQLYIHGSYRTPTGHAEALGLSILEAEAVGTPVIAFDSGGVGEAVDNNKTGYLVPEKDVVGMSTKIAMLLADFERWNSFSRAGVDFVRTHFDITKCCSQLEDIYDNIIDMHVRDRSC